MVMKNPPHPDRSIKDACLDPLGLTVTEGARVLNVARHTLSRLINAQARTHENRIDVKRYEAVWKMNIPILPLNPNNPKQLELNQKTLSFLSLAQQARGHWFESSITHIDI